MPVPVLNNTSFSSMVLFDLQVFLGNEHSHGRHKSAPNTPSGSEYAGISALEKEKVNDILPVFETGFCYTQSLVF